MAIKRAVKRKTPTRVQLKTRNSKETPLLAAIRLAIGTRPDVLSARINTGLFTVKGGGRVRSAPTGYPDLQCVQLRRVKTRRTVETNFSLYEGPEHWFYYGQTVYIETKRPKTDSNRAGTITQEQQDFCTAARAVGADYIMPTTVQEVLDLLGPVPDWVREGRS